MPPGQRHLAFKCGAPLKEMPGLQLLQSAAFASLVRGVFYFYTNKGWGRGRTHSAITHGRRCTIAPRRWFSLSRPSGSASVTFAAARDAEKALARMLSGLKRPYHSNSRSATGRPFQTSHPENEHWRPDGIVRTLSFRG